LLRNPTAGWAQSKITAPPIKAALAGSDVDFAAGANQRFGIVERIRRLAPDVIVVMAYGQILPRAVLEIRIASLNLHASLLPLARTAHSAAFTAGNHGRAYRDLHG
jgi:methionyl-tRNA formyltransferase